MNANPELRLAEDVWVQMLAILALVSGAFTAADLLPRFRTPHGAPPRPAAPAPPVPGARAGGGPLIVDARGGAEAGFAGLGQALAAAKDGDSIILKPGVYDEAVTVSKSVVITGAGAKPSDVTLTFDGPRTLTVTAGRVFLKQVALANRSTLDGSAAAEVAGGSLVLEQFEVAAAKDGIRLKDGELDASYGSIQAGRGLLALGRSKVSLLKVDVSAGRSGVSIDGMGELRVESSELKASGSAVEAAQFAKVRMSEVAVTQCGANAVTARSGAEVRITRSRLADNKGCGVGIDGGSVTLERVRLERNRCGVGFLGAGSLESLQSEYSRLELGPLAIKPGRERDVVVKGSGNIGLEIPEKK